MTGYEQSKKVDALSSIDPPIIWFCETWKDVKKAFTKDKGKHLRSYCGFKRYYMGNGR